MQNFEASDANIDREPTDATNATNDITGDNADTKDTTDTATKTNHKDFSISAAQGWMCLTQNCSHWCFLLTMTAAAPPRHCILLSPTTTMATCRVLHPAAVVSEWQHIL